MYIRFSHVHPDSLWDEGIVRLILSLWELCQTYNVAMVYNGEFSRGRNHLCLQDFRLQGKFYSILGTYDFILLLVDTLMHLTNYYMEEVRTPFRGFRLKSKYSRIISKNPANQGRLFLDPHGRPSGAIFASLYLGHGHSAYYYGTK